MATEISKLRAQGKNYVRDSIGPQTVKSSN